MIPFNREDGQGRGSFLNLGSYISRAGDVIGHIFIGGVVVVWVVLECINWAGEVFRGRYGGDGRYL